ncbi:Uma2 family endonuclease [Streptomyces sp. NPDC087300]|uniref:Uma2 family endonuclease n=1 Tax=Streptomyces sp. NPDC087300 TaxID=3365780 RepID=UPI003828B9C1
MTAAPVEHGMAPDRRSWDRLLQAWRELDVPEGWHAEIDEGQIVLVPPPHRHHNGIAALLHRTLYGVISEELEVYQALGIHITPLDKLYVPDLVLAPRALVDAADPDTNDPLDASEALLVVEITSRSNAKDDRTKKLWAYGHAPVPVYLLVDRFDEHGPTVTLFTGPQNGAYKHTERVPFGEVVKLPEPFASTVDTAGFPG